MKSITGIEFGPDVCVLVRARPHRDGIELSAAHILRAELSPAGPYAAEQLRRIRREKGFHADAHVVSWTSVDRSSAADPASEAALRPLVAAGFRIAAVLSPQEALSSLASQRRRANGASAWLAINRSGGAIAIVRGSDTLYSRAFRWSWESAAIGSQAQLLQRYTVVAHVAPEIRRGIESVRAKYGVPVDAIVTCGDLPDLRSLTMPLIEELDLEVETLDSAEGLVIGGTRRDQLPDALSALRLACGAAMAAAPARPLFTVARLARGAVLTATAAALVWVGFAWWMRSAPARSPSGGAPPAMMSGPAQRPEARAAESPPPAAAIAPTRTTGTGETTPVAADSRDTPRVNEGVRMTPAPVRATPAPRAARPSALRDPLPVIDTILVSSDRRIAVIDGAIVSVGDIVGQRTVVRIEPEAVSLKEPSGLEIRVPIRVRRAP